MTTAELQEQGAIYFVKLQRVSGTIKILNW